MTRDDGGFTLIEVMVAVVILALGIVALASSSAMVTRMVGRGQTSTFASQIAARRLEQLRSIAYSSDPRCTSVNFADGSAAATSKTGNVGERWVITSGATTATRNVSVFVTYKLPRGLTKTDTISTIIPCV